MAFILYARIAENLFTGAYQWYGKMRHWRKSAYPQSKGSSSENWVYSLMLS